MTSRKLRSAISYGRTLPAYMDIKIVEDRAAFGLAKALVEYIRDNKHLMGQQLSVVFQEDTRRLDYECDCYTMTVKILTPEVGVVPPHGCLCCMEFGEGLNKCTRGENYQLKCVAQDYKYRIL